MTPALRALRAAAASVLAIGLIASQVSPAVAANRVTAATFWNNATVHTVAITARTADLSAAVAAYRANGDKVWVKVTVRLDGRAFAGAGIRLKGNSSLRSISATSTPQSLPWLVRLDKYAVGQSLNGMSRFVIRSNVTATALNEAVALELIGRAGLATQRAIATKVSVNGSKPTLRLVIENPDDAWYARVFGGTGLLYKAEATGDYSYRGESATAYVDVFDQETQKDDEDFAPLTRFLKFINQSTDAEFAAHLGEYLDVPAFATYLAVQDLLDNFDDIEGPGNNSYLRYDASSRRMTVVSWDQNLSFGVQPQGPGGQPGGRPGLGAQPGPGGPGGPGAAGPGSGAPPSKGNILAERFRANSKFAALITAQSAQLRQMLYSSGVAAKVLNRWVTLLRQKGSGLVPTATITSEAAAIRKHFA